MQVVRWCFPPSQQLQRGIFSTAVWLLLQLCCSWPECLPCTDGSFIFYHGLQLAKMGFSTEMGVWRGRGEQCKEKHIKGR